jgi:hypothetical protein
MWYCVVLGVAVYGDVVSCDVVSFVVWCGVVCGNAM